MSKFRKKPVVIDAWCFDGSFESVAPVMSDPRVILVDRATDAGLSNQIDIHTLEGTMTADTGDWIVRGIKGEIYPVKPDVFAETYEPVED